jgi:hypothetical protein
MSNEVLIPRNSFKSLSAEKIQEQITMRLNMVRAMGGSDADVYKQPILNDIAELEVIKIEKHYPNGLEELKELAIYLHSNFCHYNHTDGCGWEYEYSKDGNGKTQHNWTGYSHKDYLEKAAKHLPHLKNIILRGKN